MTEDNIKNTHKELTPEEKKEAARLRKTELQRRRRMKLQGKDPDNWISGAQLLEQLDPTDKELKVRTNRNQKLLAYQKVEIDTALVKISDKSFLSMMERVDDKLAQIINSDVMGLLEDEKYVDGDGVTQHRMILKDKSKITREQRASISKIKYLSNGGVEIVAHDKLKAIDMLYKRVGAYRGSRGSVDGSGDKSGADVNLNVSGDNVMVVAGVGDNGRGRKVDS